MERNQPCNDLGDRTQEGTASKATTVRTLGKLSDVCKDRILQDLQKFGRFGMYFGGRMYGICYSVDWICEMNFSMREF